MVLAATACVENCPSKPLGAFSELLGESRANAGLLELRKVLDEYPALQVVHFMLNADCQQPLRFKNE